MMEKRKRRIQRFAPLDITALDAAGLEQLKRNLALIATTTNQLIEAVEKGSQDVTE